MQFPFSFFGGAGKATIAGFIAGGMNTSNVRQTAIQKLTKSTETFGLIAATISTAVRNPAGFSSSSSGYCAGGSIAAGFGTASGDVTKLNFASETTSAVSSLPLSGNALSRYSAGCFSAAAGYVLGRGDAATDIQKLSFSSDTTSLTGTNLLSVYGTWACVFFNDFTAYTLLTATTNVSFQFQTLSFSTETCSSGSSFGVFVQFSAAAIFSDANGYIFQNFDSGSNSPDCVKYNIETDTLTTLYPQMDGSAFWGAFEQSSVNFIDSGYMISSAASSSNNAVKCTFATDTMTQVFGVNQTNGGAGAGHIQY